jgi:nucleoside-diphosphate-sugar epimerase
VSRPLVVVTGATGFIGSAVLADLRRRGARIRQVGRRPASQDPHGRTQWICADLGQPASLRGVCEGAFALLHLASYVGPDEDRCHTVNTLGSEALAAEATRSRVPRIIHLSTCAVYGAGPHRGIDVNQIPPAPVSATSRTRLAAESALLNAGAAVLRPGLVLGAGDRWVVPALADLARRIPTRWDGGRGRLSTVAVTDLARLIGHAALHTNPLSNAVHHASHPGALRIGDLMATLAHHRLVGEAHGDLPWPECLDRLHATSGWVSERQFHLLARDHWYRSDQIWQTTQCPPGPDPLQRVAEAAPWYREHLQ